MVIFCGLLLLILFFIYMLIYAFFFPHYTCHSIYLSHLIPVCFPSEVLLLVSSSPALICFFTTFISLNTSHKKVFSPFSSSPLLSHHSPFTQNVHTFSHCHSSHYLSLIPLLVLFSVKLSVNDVFPLVGY